jgi:hypothetical protein
MSPIADPNPSVSIGLHAAYRFKLDVQHGPWFRLGQALTPGSALTFNQIDNREGGADVKSARPAP